MISWLSTRNTRMKHQCSTYWGFGLVLFEISKSRLLTNSTDWRRFNQSKFKIKLNNYFLVLSKTPRCVMYRKIFLIKFFITTLKSQDWIHFIKINLHWSLHWNNSCSFSTLVPILGFCFSDDYISIDHQFLSNWII